MQKLSLSTLPKTQPIPSAAKLLKQHDREDVIGLYVELGFSMPEAREIMAIESGDSLGHVAYSEGNTTRTDAERPWDEGKVKRGKGGKFAKIQRKDAEGLPLALAPQIMADFILGADPLTDIQGWTELEVLQEGGALASFLLSEYLPGAEGRWDTIVAPDVLRRVILSADPMVNISPWDESEVAGEAQAILTFLMEEYRRSSIEDLLKTPADYIPQDAAQYTEASTEPEATCKECFAYLDTRRCRIVRGHISPYGKCALWESATPLLVNRNDDNKPVQRIVDWQGLKLGLQYLPGDIRHGKRITAAYGNVRGTYGQADDGMAFDVWVNLKGGDRCFKLQQLTDEGEHDEFKYILGASSLEDAKAIYTANMPSRLMGEVVECEVDELAPVVNRKDADEPWDEKKVVRGKGGKFAKKASAPLPMPVGTDKQRNAPDDEPGATFATKLSSGSNYCAVSPKRAKDWASAESELAHFALSALESAGRRVFSDQKEIDAEVERQVSLSGDLFLRVLSNSIVRRERLEQYQSMKDAGALPEPARKWGVDRKTFAHVSAITSRGIDFPTESSPVDPQKVGEALDEYYLKEASPYIAKRLYPEEEREDIKARTVAMLSSAKSMDELEAMPTVISQDVSFAEEAETLLRKSSLDLEAAARALNYRRMPDELLDSEKAAYAMLDAYARESGKPLIEAFDQKRDELFDIHGAVEDEMSAEYQQPIQEAAEYFESAKQVLGSISARGDEEIRSISGQDGEILQVASIVVAKEDETISVDLLASSATSMPAKHRTTLLKAIETIVNDSYVDDEFRAELDSLKGKIEAKQEGGKISAFKSADALEGIISEKHLRGMEGALITCSPIARNIPLFRRAGFEDGYPFAPLKMTSENAEKFWRMRQARSQRQDAGEYTQGWADKWDRDLAKLEAELGPMMCGGSKTRADAGLPWDEKKVVRGKGGRFAKKPAPEAAPQQKKVDRPTAKTETIKAVEGWMESRFGAEQVRAANMSISRSLKGSRVRSRTTLSGIIGILNDGAMKTQFETGNSMGAFSPYSRWDDSRLDAEKSMFEGRGTIKEAEKAPVYGYIYHPDHPSAEGSVDGYGEVVIEMKDEVRERTTIAAGDTLGKTYLPSPLNSPSAASWLGFQGGNWEKPAWEDPNTYEIESDWDDNVYASRTLLGSIAAAGDFQDIRDVKGSYMEAQIHGGVKTTDIKSIKYEIQPYSGEDYFSKPWIHSGSDINLFLDGLEKLGSKDNLPEITIEQNVDISAEIEASPNGLEAMRRCFGMGIPIRKTDVSGATDYKTWIIKSEEDLENYYKEVRAIRDATWIDNSSGEDSDDSYWQTKWEEAKAKAKATSPGELGPITEAESKLLEGLDSSTPHKGKKRSTKKDGHNA